MYQFKMEIVKAAKLVVRSKIYLFSNLVQDYGNRSADIWLGMQAVSGGLSLSVNITIFLLPPKIR